jgi:carboxypeptidase T
LNFSIFPNPYSDNITVQISSVFNLSEAKIFITNNLGQLLLTFYPNNYSQLLNLSSLSSGMYFLTVQGNENKRTVKIIKQ